MSKLELVDHDKPENYPAGIVRPTLGCRAIVQRSLRVCTIVLREMTDWKDDVRLHSLKLLWQIVLHSEKALTAKFIEINPVLGSYCNDSERSISDEAIRVCRLLGQLLDYDSWIEHAIKRLEVAPNLGYLRLFTAMLKEATGTKDICRIATILGAPNICHSLHEDYKRVIHELCEHLIGLHGADGEDAERLLYIVIINVIACSDQNIDDGIAAIGNDLLLKLCCGDNDRPEMLHTRYLAAVVDSIEGLDSANTESSEPIILSHGLISLCGFQPAYLPNLTAEIQMVAEHGNPTGKIKIFSAISIAALSWTESMTTTQVSVSESVELLQRFLDDCILPQLIWRAGRSSESLRAISTTALCSWSMGAAEETKLIFADLGVHFIQLVEDNCVVTRACALRCLLVVGAVPVEQLKPLDLGKCVFIMFINMGTEMHHIFT